MTTTLAPSRVLSAMNRSESLLRERSRLATGREIVSNDRAKGVETNMWYCLKCRNYTATLNVKRKTFTTKTGSERRYHQGWCAVCDSKKANMKPW